MHKLLSNFFLFSVGNEYNHEKDANQESTELTILQKNKKTFVNNKQTRYDKQKRYLTNTPVVKSICIIMYIYGRTWFGV